MTQILVVDDEPQSRNMMELMLVAEGYQVTQARDGHQALRMLHGQPNPIRPDLILLDIVMSGLSGYDVAKRIKGDPRTDDIPIVFITAKDEPQDVARSCGRAADYFHKPFKETQLLARVRSVLRLRELYKETLRERTTGESLSENCQT